MTKKVSFFLASLFAISIQVMWSAETPALIDRPSGDGGPTQVSVGIWIVDISKIDSAEQSFTAEVAIVLRWKDPRLAHTGSGIARYPLEEVWHPRTVIANETSSVSRKFPDSVEVESDGTVTYRQRYAGAFTQPAAVAIVPFRPADFSDPPDRCPLPA
jgi:gamma-aminobutyric acid receptor subunit beta